MQYRSFLLIALITLEGMAFGQDGLSQQQLGWEVGNTGCEMSLRGICLRDGLLWVSGAGGKVLRSEDLGENWVDVSPPRLDACDFRCIVAFDQSNACIVNSGDPAVIMRTSDGGGTWREVFTHPNRKAFLNGMVFGRNGNGFVFGDPLDGRWCLLRSKDFGTTWQIEENTPSAEDEEAGFAASNTSMAIHENQLWIGTGGSTSESSRLLQFSTNEATAAFTRAINAPLRSSSTEGIFSVLGTHVQGRPKIVVAGGDYRIGETSSGTIAVLDVESNSWHSDVSGTHEFRSALGVTELDISTGGNELEHASSASRIIIAIGPTGSEFSHDGIHWHHFSDVGFHAIAADGASVVAVGANGKFGVLKVNP